MSEPGIDRKWRPSLGLIVFAVLAAVTALPLVACSSSASTTISSFEFDDTTVPGTMQVICHDRHRHSHAPARMPREPYVITYECQSELIQPLRVLRENPE
jgi:hypothetical protein